MEKVGILFVEVLSLFLSFFLSFFLLYRKQGCLLHVFFPKEWIFLVDELHGLLICDLKSCSSRPHSSADPEALCPYPRGPQRLCSVSLYGWGRALHRISGQTVAATHL